jgi:hypothetical protein
MQNNNACVMYMNFHGIRFSVMAIVRNSFCSHVRPGRNIRFVLCIETKGEHYIVHLHPVAHCYFTYTFLFRLLCGLLMFL